MPLPVERSGAVLDLDGLYREHAADVARWAASLAGPPWDVDDVVQDVFLIVQRKLQQYRPNGKVTTWLFEITRRVVYARWRRQRYLRWLQRRLGEGSDLRTMALGPLELIERRQAAEMTYRLLEAIPEKYRTTLVLFELESHSGPEVAELTGTTLENVWIRLHRGRTLFAKRFRAFVNQGGSLP